MRRFGQDDAFLVGAGSVTRRAGELLDGTKAIFSLFDDTERPLSDRDWHVWEHGSVEPRASFLTRIAASDWSPQAVHVLWAQLYEHVFSNLTSSVELPIKARLEKLGGGSYEPIVQAKEIVREITEQLSHIDKSSVEQNAADTYASAKMDAYEVTGFLKQKTQLHVRRAGRSSKPVPREALTLDAPGDTILLGQIQYVLQAQCSGLISVEQILPTLEKLHHEGVEPRVAVQQVVSRFCDLLAQQIYRTWRGGYHLALLAGYQEQGFVKVQWRAHTHQLATRGICRMLHGQQLTIDRLLREGKMHPVSYLTHDGCRCTVEPVISYVTLPVYEELAGHKSPRQFVQGDPIFDDRRLDVVDVLRESYVTPLTIFYRLPAEHQKPLDRLIAQLHDVAGLDKIPHIVDFVRDVYELDAYQMSGEIKESLPGQVLCWWAAQEGVLYLSSYAAEFEPIEAVYLGAWATRLWHEEPVARSIMGSGTPTREPMMSLDLSSVQVRALASCGSPFPLVRVFVSHTLEQAVGWSDRALHSADGIIRGALLKLDFPVELVQAILQVRGDYQVWDLKTGAYLGNQEPHRTELDPVLFEARWREAVVLFFLDPWSLWLRDVAFYDRLVGFFGKDLRT